MSVRDNLKSLVNSYISGMELVSIAGDDVPNKDRLKLERDDAFPRRDKFNKLIANSSVYKYLVGEGPATDQYKAACAEEGVAISDSSTRVEYVMVLFPSGGGKISEAIWMRDHSDTEAWVYEEQMVGEEHLKKDLMYFSSGKNKGQPLVMFKVIAVKEHTGVTKDAWRFLQSGVEEVLDSHFAYKASQAEENVEWESYIAARADGLFV